MTKCESCGCLSPTVKTVEIAPTLNAAICYPCSCLRDLRDFPKVNVAIKDLNIGEFVRLMRAVIIDHQQAMVHGINEVASPETKQALKEAAKGDE